MSGTLGEAYLAAHRIDAGLACSAWVQYHPAFSVLESPALFFPLQRERAGAFVGRHVFCFEDDVEARSFPPCKEGETWDTVDRTGIFATAKAFDTGRLVFVLRPIDALSLAMCGVPAIATCGYEPLPWLPARCAGAKVIYIAFDDNEAGEGAAWSLCTLLKPTGARIQRLQSTQWGGHWNAALVTHGPKVLCEELRRVMVSKHRPHAPG